MLCFALSKHTTMYYIACHNWLMKVEHLEAKDIFSQELVESKTELKGECMLGLMLLHFCWKCRYANTAL